MGPRGDLSHLLGQASQTFPAFLAPLSISAENVTIQQGKLCSKSVPQGESPVTSRTEARCPQLELITQQPYIQQLACTRTQMLREEGGLEEEPGERTWLFKESRARDREHLCCFPTTQSLSPGCFPPSRSPWASERLWLSCAPKASATWL